MPTSSPRAKALPDTLFAGLAMQPRNSPVANGLIGRNSPVRPLDGDMPRVNHPVVEIWPSHLVERRAVTRHGLTAEIVRAKTLDRIDFRFRAPVNLLIVYEQSARREGYTFVEGLPRSTLRELTHKLTFVPAGHEYREQHDPRVMTRLMYFYFDSSRPTVQNGLALAGRQKMRPAPRLLFEDPELLCTARKLQTLIEDPECGNQPYFEALGVILTHELTRIDSGAASNKSPVRGGLAARQERLVAEYIEKHFAQHISLATLASLVHLSPHYFCRAFKQSFGVTPHHYHRSHRIEQAKTLLADPSLSVTEIGLTLGFSTTSSFTATFHKVTGRTPTAYRRNLV